MKEKIYLVSVSVLFVIFLTGGISLAGDILATPPMRGNSTLQVIECSIVNLSTEEKEVEVTWACLDGSSAVSDLTNMPPGASYVVSYSVNICPSLAGYCKFQLESRDKKRQFRASGCIYHIADICTNTVLAQ
ncbi:MAG: hypothetical protein ACYSR0_05790 [Planctomycetota bacterium]|jgi:hypothetical protein